MLWPQKLNSVSLTPTPGTLALERIRQACRLLFFRSLGAKGKISNPLRHSILTDFIQTFTKI
jgi:hypothetical protein